MALVLDTGVLLAAHDSTDRAHNACAALLSQTREPLVIPAPVLVELEFFFRKRRAAHAWQMLAEDVAAGVYELFPITPALVLAAARLQATYADLPLGFVDAAVFETCRALGEGRVATLHRRDFTVLRTPAGTALDILP